MATRNSCAIWRGIRAGAGRARNGRRSRAHFVNRHDGGMAARGARATTGSELIDGRFADRASNPLGDDRPAKCASLRLLTRHFYPATRRPEAFSVVAAWAGRRPRVRSGRSHWARTATRGTGNPSIARANSSAQHSPDAYNLRNADKVRRLCHDTRRSCFFRFAQRAPLRP